MHQPHFLLSAEARTLSMREVFALSDDEAFELFREVGWGREGSPVCPACGVVEPHWFLPSRRQWRCPGCGYTFSVTSGTIFAHHKLPLQVYLGAVAIYTSALKGLFTRTRSQLLGGCLQGLTEALYGKLHEQRQMDCPGCGRRLSRKRLDK